MERKDHGQSVTCDAGASGGLRIDFGSLSRTHTTYDGAEGLLAAYRIAGTAKLRGAMAGMDARGIGGERRA